MSGGFILASTKILTVLTTSLLLTGGIGAAAAADLGRTPERGGIGLDLQLKSSPEKEGRTLEQLEEAGLPPLDPRLSIIVTDQESTDALKFSDVMQKLAEDLNIPKKLDLFQRWWGMANSVFCDSGKDSHGFLYSCHRAEGGQAVRDPFANEGDPKNEDWYRAIAFSNRFDLADQDGGNCGEYRIIFAKNSPKERNLIIFEAQVPNPEPPLTPSSKGLQNVAGCRQIVKFWRSLSDTHLSELVETEPDTNKSGPKINKRGALLRNFFLHGSMPNGTIKPVVDANNYAGGPKSGQIRTNQFDGEDWTLREFKVDGDSIVPATVKSNPGDLLFGTMDPRRLELANYLVREDVLDALRGVRRDPLTGTSGGDETNLQDFSFPTLALDNLNSFESNESFCALGDVLSPFNDVGKNDAIGQQMDAALVKANSKLSTDNVIHRMRTQTCAGCHHYSSGDKELGVVCPPPGKWPKACFDDKLLSTLCGDGRRTIIWPNTLGGDDDKGCGTENRQPRGFTHVSEREFESDAPGGKRYKISDALKLVLLPPRCDLMIKFLSEDRLPEGGK